MERPNNFYPERPKLKDFSFRATNLKAVTSPSGSTDVPPATSYQAIDEATYAQYLASHTRWVDSIHSVDSQLHEFALRKRALEHYREVVDLVGEDTPSNLARDDVVVPHYPNTKVRVRMERKQDHPPVLSTKPHRAEKRANRNKVRDSRVKLAANVHQAKAEVLMQNTVPVIKARLEAIQEVTSTFPLHKVEASAAKSAAERAKFIRSGSTDLVVNVSPDDGWKLVTRKKGDILKSGMVHRQTVGNDSYVTTYIDPAAQSSKSVLQSAVRQPNAVGVK
jgi:hypothetical protein